MRSLILLSFFIDLVSFFLINGPQMYAFYIPFDKQRKKISIEPCLLKDFTTADMNVS